MKLIKMWGMLCVTATMWLTSAYAVCPLTYAQLDLGYRWDKSFHRFSAFTEGGGLASNPVKNSDLNSFQLGGKVQLSKNNWFIRGSGHYGWIPSGDYFEASFFTRNLYGHTVDAYGSAGYLFCLHPCWGLGPVIGYSWDKMVLNSNHFIQVITGGAPAFVDQGRIETFQTFHGPLIGLDALFQPSRCLQVELEWNIIKGQWKFEDSLTVLPGRNSKRTHDLVWGNLFHIDTTFFPFPCWSIGLDLKYITRNNQGFGVFKRTRVPVVFQHQVIDDLSWQTFTAMLHLGYNF